MDDGHSARVDLEMGNRIERYAVIHNVCSRRHHYVARRSDPLLQ
jgi:hypothetical protein